MPAGRSAFPGGTLYIADGTSMSAPIVSGVAALLFAHYAQATGVQEAGDRLQLHAGCRPHRPRRLRRNRQCSRRTRGARSSLKSWRRPRAVRIGCLAGDSMPGEAVEPHAPRGAADFKSSPTASADFGRPEKVLQTAVSEECRLPGVSARFGGSCGPRVAQRRGACTPVTQTDITCHEEAWCGGLENR